MCEHNCGIDHSLEEIPENSLFNQINLEDSECFNESEDNPLKYCIKPYNERHNSKFLESDIDPELLIKIIFNNFVDINGIKILSTNEFCPREVKFFKNNESLTFDDVGGMKPIHTITPNNNILTDVIYPLPPSKFSGLEVLYLYIENNLGGETTKINYIDFNGKINNLKKKGVVNCVYEVSPQAKKIDSFNEQNMMIS